MTNTCPELATTAIALHQGNGEMGQAALAVLDDLRLSLQAGIHALLARDVASLERATENQKRLLPLLGALLDPMSCQGSLAPGSFESPSCNSLARVSRLREAASHVLRLGRLQAAVLKRAKRSLTVLSNLMAGSERVYTPAESPAGIGIASSGCSRKGESACQD